uniref:Uncharacterized protein n=1 Tax=viral metagenome TaxID=1070528 RepID=A0A6C0KZF0_9ZZZZ
MSLLLNTLLNELIEMFLSIVKINLIYNTIMYIIKMSIISTMCMGFVQKSHYQRQILFSPILSTKKDIFTGKIYVGEPELLDNISDILEKIKDTIDKTVDSIFGPEPNNIPIPIPIPIPVEDNPNPYEK